MKQTAFIARFRSVRLLLALLIGAGVLGFSLSRPVMADSAARDRAQAQQPAPAPDAAPNDLFGSVNLSADVAAAMSDVALDLVLNPVRYRSVSLNDAMLATSAADYAAGRSSSAETFRLNLFGDAVYTAYNIKILPRYQNAPGYIWYGQIQGMDISDVVLVVTPDFIEGRVWTPGRNFIITLSGGLYTLIEVNPEDAAQRTPQMPQFPSQYQVAAASPEAAAILDPAAAAGVAPDGQPLTAAAADGVVVDVLIAYTTGAMAGQNLSQFTAAVEAEVTLVNAALSESQANFQINMVQLVSVSYTESDFETDLNRITGTSDGFMDNIHALRNQYGADLVALLRGTGEYCGIAWLMTTVSTTFASNGFSVTGRDCFGYYSFIHEIAHNMGSNHDPANAGGGGAYSYSYGYQHPGGLFRTVMGYANGCPNPCPRVGRFSNPNVLYNGNPTGTATQNNALSLSNTAPTVAQFRVNNSQPIPSVSAPTGTITTGYGNPSYTWNDTGASTYELAVWLLTPSAPTSLAPNSVIYYGQNLADGTYCNGTTCTINPANLTESARLVNGTYAAYVRTTGGTWSGATNFTLNAPALAPITISSPSSMTNPVTVSSLTPTFNWGLNGMAANATWFNLYIAPKAQFDAGNYTPTFNQWQSRADRCGGVSGTSCSFTAPALVENTIYYFFVQSYGPSGYSTGGQYSNGWEGGAFLVDSVPNPALPTNLATNINSGHPSLSWTSPAAATSHSISIYNWTTNTWVYYATHNKSGDAALTCSGGTCTFKSDAFYMTNGGYSFYVNSINANGTSLGGPFGNGYAGPVTLGNTGEAGDFGITVDAPTLPAAVNGSIGSGNIVGSWQTPNHTTYFNVWVGTAGAAQTYVFQTLSTLDLGCENPTQTCNFSIPLAGLGIPTGTQLYMAVQAVGPGGYATTGGEASNGYRVSAVFNAP